MLESVTREEKVSTMGSDLTDLVQFRAQVQATRDLKQDLEQKLSHTRDSLRDLEDVQRVLRMIAEKINEPSGVVTTRLITTALQSVFFDQDLALDLEHSISRGKPAIEVRLHDRKRQVIDDPMDSAGGGPRYLIGILLRVLTIIRKPHLARLLILDEPLKEVSPKYQRRATQLLRQICESPERGGLGFTMFVVTHDEALKKVAHRSYHGSVKQDGISLEITRTKDITEDHFHDADS